MGAAADDDTRITAEDLAAADELLTTYPGLVGEKPDLARTIYAKSHARLGNSRFRLRYGLRSPANGGEAIEVEYFRGTIDRDEFRRRHTEYVKRPADEEMLKTLIDELTERVHRYSAFLVAIAELDEGTRRVSLSDVDRLARRMVEKLCIYATELDTVCQFLGFARVRHHQPQIRAKDCPFPTILDLVMTVVTNAHRIWTECLEDARRSRPSNISPNAAEVTSCFWASFHACLPSPKELMTLVHHERSIGLLELEDRRKLDSSAAGSEATLTLQLHGQNVSVSVAAAGTSGEENANAEVKEPLIRVTDWLAVAVGISERGEYWVLSPPPATGHVFPKSKASRLPMSGRRWQKLIGLLAASPTGNRADAFSVAATLELVPPGTSQLGDSRARPGAVQDGRNDEDDLSLGGPPWRSELREALADLARKFRQYVAGPTGRGKAVLSIEGDYVMSGFVVRYLLQDENRHLLFGNKPP